MTEGCTAKSGKYRFCRACYRENKEKSDDKPKNMNQDGLIKKGDQQDAAMGFNNEQIKGLAIAHQNTVKRMREEIRNLD